MRLGVILTVLLALSPLSSAVAQTRTVDPIELSANLARAAGAQRDATSARDAFTRALANAPAEAAQGIAAGQDQALKTMQTADARLADARQKGDGAAAAEAVQQYRAAATQFRDLQQRLQGLIANVGAQFESSRSAAQNAITEAADADRRAAATASAPALADARSTLQRARTAFDDAAKARSVDGMVNAQRLAVSSRDAFRAAESSATNTQAALANARTALGRAQTELRRLDAMLGGRPASPEAAAARNTITRSAQRLSGAAPALAEIDAAAKDADAARQTITRAIDSLVASMLSASQTRLEGVGRDLDHLEGTLRNPDARATLDDQKQVADLRGRLAGARRQLDQVNVSKDAAALPAVDRAADDLAGAIGQLARAVEARLAAATGVPADLLLAAREFFSGRYEPARTALDRTRTADKTASIRLQASLFRAAVLFGLYVRGGERDATLKQGAAAAVNECRRLQPTFVPDPKAFSPRFRRFFQSPS